MRLCISNISWNSAENNEIINRVLKNQIKLLEFAPSSLKKFHNYKSFQYIKKYYQKRSLKLYSMQSLLFNMNNNFIFGNKFHQKNLLAQIKNKIKLAKYLGVKVIVFGSPKIKKNILNKSVPFMEKDILIFIKKIKKIVTKNKITFCIEANPKYYGGDYLTKTSTALKIVKKIHCKFIKLNLDLGTIISNKENFNNIINKNMQYIGHVQLSLPKLKNIKSFLPSFLKYLKLLKEKKYKKAVSIEQLALNFNTNNIAYILNFFSNKGCFEY